MSVTTRRTTWLLPAATALLPALLAGCSIERMNEMHRSFNKPDDYATSPLGVAFDTPEEAAQLNDAKLRADMDLWFTVREQYLAAWRRYGPYDDRTRKLVGRRSMLTSVIQDYVTQLQANGIPLTGGR